MKALLGAHGRATTTVLGALAVVASGLAVLGPLPAALAADGPCSVADNTVTCTFTSTGDEQSFTVPDDVTSVSVVAVGASGASGSSDFNGHVAVGGLGGSATAQLTVTPGDVLFVEVGGVPVGGGCYSEVQCVGGFNGGGSSHFGGGGGGASDVRAVSNLDEGSLASRLIVAAGGGGGGEGFDTAAGDGGDAGQAGDDAAGNEYATGAAGGGAGTDSAGGSPGGSLGSGGNGGGDTGGAGGGGLYGGGGGANLKFEPVVSGLLGAGGGGGGSSYAPGGTTGLATAGQQPSVTISYALVPPSITADVSSDAPANDAGWYHTPVTVTFTCDAGTAVLTAPCPEPVVLDQDGADQTVTRDIATEAGATDSVTVSNIDLDQTAPEITDPGLHDGTTYLASLPVATCTGSDALSGLDACTLTGTSVEKAGAWRYHYTATALDVAGNSTEASGTVTVLKSGVAKSALRKGAWDVEEGRVYNLLVANPARARLVGVATGNAGPGGVHRPFTRDGSVLGTKRWVTSVRITAAMAAHPNWTYTVKAGTSTLTIKIRIVG